MKRYLSFGCGIVTRDAVQTINQSIEKWERASERVSEYVSTATKNGNEGIDELAVNELPEIPLCHL